MLPAQKTALICGVTGQDGSYLARFLLARGYRVIGTSRDAHVANRRNLQRLGVADRILVESMTLTDFRSVIDVLSRHGPDEVYNLSGQSSVGLSFAQPVETLDSIAMGTLNLLEAIRFLKQPIRMYNAGSSECFGDTGGLPANEDTPFRPRSPYAVAKASAFWQVANYREAYGLHACSGLLFNHESPLRPERFVVQKIVRAAQRIAAGSGETLSLGRLDIERDWGAADEYVDAMWRMLQAPQPDDYVIATGESQPLSAVVQTAFALLGLDADAYVRPDPSLHRPADIRVSRADPSRAAQRLGWSARKHMAEVVRDMLHSLPDAAIDLPPAPSSTPSECAS